MQKKQTSVQNIYFDNTILYFDINILQFHDPKKNFNFNKKSKIKYNFFYQQQESTMRLENFLYKIKFYALSILFTILFKRKLKIKFFKYEK